MLLYFLFFGHRLSRVGRSGTRRYYTHSVAPVVARKLCRDIRPMLPPFFTGGKMSQILAQILTPVVFGPPYFCTVALCRKTKSNLSRTDDSSTTIPKLGWVAPPTPRTVGAMGTPKGKSGNFFIYPPFQRPTPSTAPPMLYHLFGPWLL